MKRTTQPFTWQDLRRLGGSAKAQRQAAGAPKGGDLLFQVGMNQLARAQNVVQTSAGSTSTTASGNNETVWSDPAGAINPAAKQLPGTGHATVQAKVKGVSADGLEFYAGELVASFYRPYRGVGVQLGATQEKHPPIRSNVAIFALISIDPTESRVFITVNDGGRAAMHWMVWVEERRTTYEMAGSASVLLRDGKPFIT